MNTNKSRRKYSAEFKSKVAVEALQERSTLSDLSKRYELHPNQIMKWKKSLSENSFRIFANTHPEKDNSDKFNATFD